MLSPAMATMLAVLTTDAAAEPGALQRALAHAVGETFDCLSVDGCRSTNDTVIVLANGRAGAVDTTRAHRRAHRGVRLARRADGARRRRRDQVRPGPRRRRPHAGRSADRGPRGRQQPARAVLAQRRRRLLGPGALGARRERRVHRSRSGRHLLQRRHRVPRRHRVRARRSRARAAHGRATRSRSSATCASRTARRRCSPPISRTRTSTRTGARREPHESPTSRTRTQAAGEKAHRPRRGAAVHPRVLGQDRRDQVRRPRDGERRARRPLRDRRRADAARRA